MKALVAKKRNKLFFWLKLIAGLYIAGGVLLYLFQEKLLFHPEKLPQDYAYKFNTKFEELNAWCDEKTVYNIIRFLPQNDSAVKGAVLYFHGNMQNISRYAKFAANFTKHGYEVWMPDYPGFGKSTGELSEQALYNEALEVYKLISAEKIPAEKIIIYGKSLGTGIAAQLASTKDCKRLILETPYYSVTSLATHYFPIYPVKAMMQYKIPSYEYLAKVSAPVTIFHGTKDRIIPYSNAEKLKQAMKPSDEFIAIEGGRHRDLNNFPLMQRKLDSLLKK